MTQLVDALHQPHTQLFLRLALGGLLLLAGVTKLTDRASFRQAVHEYEILPMWLERPFAALLPWLETALGGLLLLGLGTVVAASLAVPLFLSFGLAIGVNLLRGRQFDCHCFGSVHGDRIGWPALFRSAALVMVALFVAAGASRFGALETALLGSSGESPPVREIIPIVFMAAVVLDVVILLPEAVAFQAGFARAGAGRIVGAERARGDVPRAATIDGRRAK